MNNDREQVIAWARDTGCLNVADYGRKSYEFQSDELERFAKLVAAAEREACAKVCDAYDVAEDVNRCDTAEGIAIAIRARGQHD